MVEQPDERRARHHRLQPGKTARVGAFLHHRQQEVERVADHLGREVLDDREPAVQPPGGERGAARRAGHAHQARHARSPALKRLDEFEQARPLDRVGLGGLGAVAPPEAEHGAQRPVAPEQPIERAGLQRVVASLYALREAEQIRDQATAGMRDQMQFGILGQEFLDQLGGVVDRADREDRCSKAYTWRP